MNLPASFITYTRALIGDEEYEQLAAALQQEPPVSIRLNRQKTERRKWQTQEDALKLLVPKRAHVPWSSEGYYLNERLTFTFDPLFHAGLYYVQEASSMFVEQVLRQYVTDAVIMLDLCAAPGGKSTHARSILPQGSLLVANELIRNRSQVLAENLTKWGNSDVVVTNNDPSDFSKLPSFFDVILTDVPCSGEGMFRKDPVAVSEWSEENVEICWQRQRRIIADIWPSLKPGGVLIYSTCTYNIKEDEENVDWIQREFGAEPLALDVPAEWKITGNLMSKNLISKNLTSNNLTSNNLTSKNLKPNSLTSEECNLSETPVYHFFPHKTTGEGFFLAALRKPKLKSGDVDGDVDVDVDGDRDGDRDRAEEMLSMTFSKAKAGKKKDKKGGSVASLVTKENLAIAESWLEDEVANDYLLSVEGTEISAFPKRYVDEWAAMKQHLKVVLAGTAVGEVKGKDLIPAHALAMSASLLKQGVFATEEITYQQAIAYLRKEAITLSEIAPRGYVLLTYRTVPLGFVKNIGNRANNLYPQEWRIRSGYLPEEIRTL